MTLCAKPYVDFRRECADSERGDLWQGILPRVGIAMIAVGHGADSLDHLTKKGATYAIHSFSELLRFA